MSGSTFFDGRSRQPVGRRATRSGELEGCAPAGVGFIMVSNQTELNEGNIAVWEAPAPWGPWSLKESGWPQGGEVNQSFAFGNFSPKWLSADGRECVFVWFRADAWNSVGCEFPVAD